MYAAPQFEDFSYFCSIALIIRGKLAKTSKCEVKRQTGITRMIGQVDVKTSCCVLMRELTVGQNSAVTKEKRKPRLRNIRVLFYTGAYGWCKIFFNKNLYI